ncbi:bacterio-opsin activator domain-containing protein [Halomicrococcus gelatinilyticus]|uniref:bacterio-opsin activator domain-containing protein n=1 Tax=Halomicrococcus gelatinilyticus TaxID=1702103 RepID=UPI002E0EAA59
MTRSDTARRAVDRLADPIVALDDGWRVTYLNDAASARFDAAIDDHLPAALPDAVGDRVREHCDRARRRDAPVSFRLALDADDFLVRVHPDSGELTLSFHPDDAASAATDAGDGRRAASSLDVDDAAEVAAELELKERAIHEAPVGITIADATAEDNPLTFINEAFSELTGYPAEEVLGRNCRFLQGEETSPEPVAAMREAIEAEDPVSVELRNYRKDGEEFWNRVDVAPVRNEDGEVTHYVGFQTDVTGRKRAEREARRRAEELEHLLERIQGLLGDVTTEVVEAETRADVEAAVCARLAASDPYELAWIGERDVGADAVTVRERAGAADVDDPDTAATVVDRALGTGALHVSEDGSTAAIPLVAEDGDYGVLVVRASRPGALDERERVVLGSLGRAIASAINARETRRILVADSVVETEFSVRGSDVFFTALSARTGCDLTYRGSVHQDDDSLVSLFSVSGGDPGAVVDAAADRDDVTSAALVTEYDGGGLVEFELPTDAIVATLSGRGGKTQSITAEDGEGRLVVEFPESADVRSHVDQLQSAYPTLDLAALRHRQRPAKTKREFVESVSDDLTDRQLAALQRAYVGGFFDWPRPVTGEEIASSMGISRSTFHEHLRAAQRKLCAEFFDDAG